MRQLAVAEQQQGFCGGATDDVDALLALRPDCVVYTPYRPDTDHVVRILEAGVNGAGSLDDEKIAAWLKKNTVETVYGKLRFDGPFNHGPAAQLIKQVQNKEWKVVWPKEFAAPGVKLIGS